MTEEKFRISPGEAAVAGRDRRKGQDKPREVAKPGRDRRKGQDKPRGSRSGGA